MLIVADKRGTTDGPAHAMLQKIVTDIPIVLVSRVHDYVFNDDLLSLEGKKWVLIDFVENGWDWDRKESHIWGSGFWSFKNIFPGEDWDKLELFIQKNPPSVMFVRELLKKDVAANIVPVNYPCWHTVPDPQTREEFESRPFELFYSWGLSHEYRKELHGEIWKQSGRYGYSVCDNIFYLNKFVTHEQHPRKWVSLNIPHYERQPIENILHINGCSKISVSLPGAGVSCFRHAESPFNSVMLMQQDEMAWSIPWEDGVNCIKAKHGYEIDTAIEWLTADDLQEHLYDAYLKGVETCRKYEVANYINHYILPIIHKQCE